MRVFKLLFIFYIIQAIIPQKACAYLDPGTGSMIVQLIVAGIAGLGCTIAVWKNKIIKFFRKGSKDD
ncbi:hypothetical protein J6G99_04790 [bacterium]|nr:hypothetical protein [bacterium]